MINAISFLLSAFFEGFIKYENSNLQSISKGTIKEVTERTRLFEDIKIGVKYVRTNSELLNILFYIFVAHFLLVQSL